MGGTYSTQTDRPASQTVRRPFAPTRTTHARTHARTLARSHAQNGAPIGDADPCSGKRPAGGGGAFVNVTFPLKAEFQNGLVCNNNDADALDDAIENRTTPQPASRVEYAHRLATRTIEFLRHAKSTGQHFFVGVGIRKPHLPWRIPRRFWELYAGKNLSVAEHQTIGENITTLAFERNGGPGYSGVYDGQKFGESPNHDHGLGPLPTELQQGLRRGYYAAVCLARYPPHRRTRTRSPRHPLPALRWVVSTNHPPSLPHIAMTIAD